MNDEVYTIEDEELIAHKLNEIKMIKDTSVWKELMQELGNQYQSAFKNAMNAELEDSKRVQYLEEMRGISVAQNMLDFLENKYRSLLNR